MTLYTDTPDIFDAGPLGLPGPDPEPELVEVEDGIKHFPCKVRGCDRGPDGGPHIALTPLARGSHMRHVHGVMGKSAPPKKDTPPPSVNINLGGDGKGKGKDPELELVEKRALQIVQFGAGFLLLARQDEDALDVQKAAPNIAVAVRDLAEYEAWLRKLAAGGDVSGRAMAWLNLSLVLVALLIPILSRHEVLPDKWAKMLETMFASGEALALQSIDAEAA